MLSEKKTIEMDRFKVRKIVNLSLKILRNCCKSNNENSLILFTEIETIAKFLALDTYAEEFFIDSFSKPFILQKMMRKDFLLIFRQYFRMF